MKVDLKKIEKMGFMEGINYLNELYDLELEEEQFIFMGDAPRMDGRQAIILDIVIPDEDIKRICFNVYFTKEKQNIEKLDEQYEFLEDYPEDVDLEEVRETLSDNLARYIYDAEEVEELFTDMLVDAETVWNN